MSVLLHWKTTIGRGFGGTGLGEKVEVIFKAYELDPNSPKTSDKTMQEVLATKYNMSMNEAKNMTDNVSEQAKSVGLNV